MFELQITILASILFNRRWTLQTDTMGFLDKVKSSVNDVGKAVNSTVDKQKTDFKLRDERKNLDQVAKEIGHAVAASLMAGNGVDESALSEQLSKYAEIKQKIAELEYAKGETSEEVDDYTPEPVRANVPEPVVEEEVQAEVAVEESVEISQEPVAETPAQKSSWNQVDDNGWVEVKDEIFWTEEEAAPATEPVSQESVQAEPVRESVQKSGTDGNEDDGGSMLNRIKSYKSNNYSGDKM